MAFLTLFTALLISGVAAWYSILGLMAIFAAAKVPILIMGGVLEIGKLVTASWLYQNWKDIPKSLKSYLTTAVVVLMLITSMGIFGFLSKAHIDQSIQTGDNTLLIVQASNRIKREQRKIDDAEKVILQLDAQVQTLIDYDRIRGPTGSIATRNSQQVERSSLNKIIDETALTIGNLQEKRSKLESQQLKLEAEVGPIRYIAEFIYGEKASREILAAAVRYVIIVIIFVFDPLAVLLLIAANMSFMRNRPKRKIIYEVADQDSNAVKVTMDPIANTEVWEEEEVVIRPKARPDLEPELRMTDEYDKQTFKEIDIEREGTVRLKRPE